jgi:hypothetical protein
MTTGFIADTKIGAGRTPFRAMRQNPATASAVLRQQMRQFVAKSAIDLSHAVFAQPRI